MRLCIVFIVLQLVSLGAESVVRIGDQLLSSKDLSLTEITETLSEEEKVELRNKQTRRLARHLENYFAERYLQEAGNPVTDEEVNQKIDEFLVMTYGTAAKPSNEYGKQVEMMAKIAPLLKLYVEDTEKAEKSYTENYTSYLSRLEWDQLKEGISVTGLEQTLEFIEAPLPTDEQIREGYRWQAHAHVLNQKFTETLNTSNIKYSDWRKERFSQVEILNADYFEIVQLAAWFGYDESSTKKDSAEKVVSRVSLPPVVEEVAEVIEKVDAPESAIEAPAEVVSNEVVGETAKQSSQWWLWLIGVVVVVGGLVLMLRRKS